MDLSCLTVTLTPADHPDDLDWSPPTLRELADSSALCGEGMDVGAAVSIADDVCLLLDRRRRLCGGAAPVITLDVFVVTERGRVLFANLDASNGEMDASGTADEVAALGAVIVELLTGSMPRTTSGAGRLATRRPDITPAVLDVVERATSHNRHGRPTSARSLVSELAATIGVERLLAPIELGALARHALSLRHRRPSRAVTTPSPPDYPPPPLLASASTVAGAKAAPPVVCAHVVPRIREPVPLGARVVGGAVIVGSIVAVVIGAGL